MTFAVADAPGYYGTYAIVYRVFHTLNAADAYARHRGRVVVLECPCKPGDRIHQIDAARYERRANGTREVPR